MASGGGHDGAQGGLDSLKSRGQTARLGLDGVEAAWACASSALEAEALARAPPRPLEKAKARITIAAASIVAPARPKKESRKPRGGSSLWATIKIEMLWLPPRTKRAQAFASCRPMDTRPAEARL